MIDANNLMFTEKYRPKKVSDLVGDFKDKILKYLQNPDAMPHFLFYSKTPGTGKSSLMRAIVNELSCDYLLLNSSDDRKIEVVRDKVKQFSMTKSSRIGKRRAVLLDEFDGMCLPFDTEIFAGSLKNPIIKKIQNINDKKYVMIPSINIKTKTIENDIGILIRSGKADFYEIELEDGRKIVASTNHPFFKKDFIETKVKDLKIGDEIIDYSNEIYKNCPICNKKILLKKTTCSRMCQNKLHSIHQTGNGNSQYGIKRSEHTRQLISKANKGRIEPEWKRKKQSEFMLKNNPMNNEESRKKISQKLKGRKFTKEWLQKISISCDKGIGTEKYIKWCQDNNKIPHNGHYRKEIKIKKELNCEICNKLLGSFGNKGIIIHHINKKHFDSRKENIIKICSTCHNHIHQGKRYNTHNNWLKTNMQKILELKIILYGENNAIN
jgi:replication factor C small subunit